MKAAHGTYVYCLVAAPVRPSLTRVARGLAGGGPVRLLDLQRGRWLAVADAPLSRFSASAIDRHLSNLDWTSRAAVAHESVVESFLAAGTVLPMKLFTLFLNDARAREHFEADRVRIGRVLRRVAGQLEWGVRVMLDPSARPHALRIRSHAPVTSGRGYLMRRKATLDAGSATASQHAAAARRLFQRLARRARSARRREAAALPADTGHLLLDAAFLVPRNRTRAFRALVGREANALERQGFRLTLTGPWPPYSFLER